MLELGGPTPSTTRFIHSEASLPPSSSTSPHFEITCHRPPPDLPLHSYLFFWCIWAVYCCMVWPLWQQTPQGRDLRQRGWQPLEIRGAYGENTSPGTSAVWVCSSVAPRAFYRQSRGIHRPWSPPSDPWRSAPNVGDKNILPEQWRDCHKYEVWHESACVHVRVSAHTFKA